MNFIGAVKTEWLTDEAMPNVQMKDTGLYRRMRLLEDFEFIDPNNVSWLASAGQVVDGASIPRVLWSVAGDPFIGAYRRASVLHDVACQQRTEPSKVVHQMFYWAMICDGVDEAQAIEFYANIRLFGPKWDVGAPKLEAPRTIETVAAALDQVLGE